jgi:hypothetical protein
MLGKFLEVIFYSKNKTKIANGDRRKPEHLSLGPAIAEDVTVVIEKDLIGKQSVADG